MNRIKGIIKEKTKICPHCGKTIKAKAIKCKWCKRWVTKTNPRVIK